MGNYFGGWYLKCQSEKQTLAVIPGVQRSEDGESYFVQVITEGGAWNTVFADGERHTVLKSYGAKIGENLFSRDGMTLSIRTADFTADGTVKFGTFTKPRYDIMGIFRYVPFMECRHSVPSLHHTVNGILHINGTPYLFENADGYLEGDCGRSFPREYAWTHCFFGDGGSLMLSVAEIPFGKIRFTGIIGSVLYGGREYRIATYLGAKPTVIGNGKIEVRQNDLTLTAVLLEKRSYPLFAPTDGKMIRTIRESAVCRSAYTLKKGGRTLFDFETDRASFEYEYTK